MEGPHAVHVQDGFDFDKRFLFKSSLLLQQLVVIVTVTVRPDAQFLWFDGPSLGVILELLKRGLCLRHMVGMYRVTPVTANGFKSGL